MIHRITERRFAISSRQVWLPGAYDSERTARYAFRFDPETLRRIQDAKGPGGVITFDDLKAYRSHKDFGVVLRGGR